MWVDTEINQPEASEKPLPFPVGNDATPGTHLVKVLFTQTVTDLTGVIQSKTNVVAELGLFCPGFVGFGEPGCRVVFDTIDNNQSSAVGCITANTEQEQNAAFIIQAALAADLGTDAARFGVIAAAGESSLINVNYGDNAINPNGSVADSIGLFQQQSS